MEININVHIHLGNDEKFNKIIELIEKWHEKELVEVAKKLKGIKKDIKSTPSK